MTARIGVLRVEQRRDGAAVATARPRVTWTVETGLPDWRQASAELDDGSGVVTLAGRDSVLVPWPFADLAPGERRDLRVRATSEDGVVTAWSGPLVVESAVAEPGTWVARPIGLADPPTEACPALLRRTLTIASPVRRATLRWTAVGVVTARINGVAVDDSVLAPGWTAYRDRVTLETTDVTELLRDGENVIGLSLAGGWATEKYGFFAFAERVYRDQPIVAAQLELEYADGSREVVATGGDWQAATGPIVASGIYAGEHVDARRRRDGWASPGFGETWPAAVVDDTVLTPEPRTAEPVRRTGTLPVAEVLPGPEGALLLDFGQNLVGRLRIRVSGSAGDRLTVRHAEVLEHGDLALRPLRNAAATATYDLAGDGEETWEPESTFFGFRYARIEGWPGAFDPAAVEAVVLGSDLHRTGWFASSHPLLDRLHENVVWGMRGNFLSVPTDCPQRDERLGWTGDLQVFAPTASFLFDGAAFLGSWLRDLELEQTRAGGLVPLVVPNVLGGIDTPIAAWGDAATVVPWVAFQRFGDLDVLRRQLPSMRAWVDAVLARTRDGLWTGDLQLGDWLDPAAPPDRPGDGRTDGDLVATAYLARSLRIVADSAVLVADATTAAHYGAEAERVRAAFVAEYVTPGGRMVSDSVTATALALEFRLVLDEDVRARLGARLRDLVRLAGYRVATGFVGTPLVADALTSAGHLDAAARLLLQTENPSWLYPVTMGATTVWERWDSLLEDGSVNPGEMTSFNHYALGAVADWMHRVVAGLAPAAPGYRELRIAPRPLPGLDSAGARHETPYGEAAVAWRRDGDEIVVTATVPPNTSAIVDLPGVSAAVGSGRHEWRHAASPAAPRPRPLGLDSPTAAILDDEEAYAAVLDALRRVDPGVADAFRTRTVWSDRRPLRGAFMFVPPQVVEEVGVALAGLAD